MYHFRERREREESVEAEELAPEPLFLPISLVSAGE